MRRIPTPFNECALVAVIAAGTAWAWLFVTGQRTFTLGSAIACALVSVVVSLVVQAVIGWACRGRPRRAHARPHPKTRKAA